jgi:hypothetical protein
VEISVNGRAPLDPLLGALRAELGRILEASPGADGQPGTVRVEDAAGSAVRLAAVVTAVYGDAIGPLCRDVREGLVMFLQREYPDAVPGPANAPPSPEPGRPATRDTQ